MIIKKYVANTSNEALTKIKYDLGKDAVIISQRKVRQQGLKGFFLPKLVEITVAVENNNNFKKRNDEANIYEGSFSSLKEIAKIHMENNTLDYVNPENNKIESIQNKTENTMKDKNVDTLTIFNELQQMKEAFNKMNNLKDPLEELLLENDVSYEIVEEIVKKAKNTDIYDKDYKEAGLRVMGDYISVNNDELKGNVVLVGPTGVGKTTTIAKLAGRMSLIEKKKVGLITVDTYRIGAVEQLRTYAEIMNLPFAVVITLKEMEAAVNSMSDCDVVLIDTTGRSSKNKMQISELRAFIEKTNSSSINLVISSVTKNKDIKNIIEGYKTLNFNNVIITKLDETNSYGALLSIMKYCKTPIRFVTTGQNVPEDIKIPTKDKVLKLIIGEDNIC
ncbi:flagellar biosynthesis protein FlhF [Clostridium amylolyticum]|uniref:Flagellar biosynthesis protein FlhF n=1 Tax=Clostridium amylolyticum TaxID=1121298 RepID=A0A1M6CGH8_9CLOT|nr:flagellar biosynthesis protein FlhF [Clostridium amylolyticum]SHI60130.1 flagellar biosynthesis protein FlhF [Clostridium amylolyticum]